VADRHLARVDYRAVADLSTMTLTIDFHFSLLINDAPRNFTGVSPLSTLVSNIIHRPKAEFAYDGTQRDTDEYLK
jgi:hypothetical protein